MVSPESLTGLRPVVPGRMTSYSDGAHTFNYRESWPESHLSLVTVASNNDRYVRRDTGNLQGLL